jgi:hypothetical protein
MQFQGTIEGSSIVITYSYTLYFIPCTSYLVLHTLYFIPCVSKPISNIVCDDLSGITQCGPENSALRQDSLKATDKYATVPENQ